MLGKMIKHEFKATSRLYVPLFILVAILTPILSLLTKIASSLGEKSIVGAMLGGFSGFGFVVMMIALCVAAFIFVAVRFYKTVATSEAYLTFCLPVNQHHIILSKLIVGMIWQMLSILVAFAAVYVMLIIQGIIAPGEITDKLMKLMPFVNGEFGTFLSYIIHMGICLFISSIAGTLMIYLSICLGQLFNEHRVISSIGMYVAIYTVVQIINLVVLLPIILNSQDIVIGSAGVMKANMDGNLPLYFFDIMAGINVVLAAVYYFFSAKILKKKTNVR